MLTENEFFKLYVEDEKVILETKKKGFPLKQFDAIVKEHPRFQILSFNDLRKALAAEEGIHIIGNWMPELQLQIASDRMSAKLMFFVTQAEFIEQKEKWVNQGQHALNEAGIVFGRLPFWEQPYASGEWLDAAGGRPPERGADAIVRYIEQPEKKPIIREDGSADYYEMNFVTPIKEGEWLGEKIPPQPGTDGMDIFGNVLPALRGEDKKLVYDKKSVAEYKEGNKIILRAAFGGALEYSGGKVGVSKQLHIAGDVGPETGSISFDGAVFIQGTILPGFSVKATGDVSVEGNEGVTNAKELLSSEGDIFIKGGVFGGGETIIEASGDIFIKHANNCKLYGRNVHVGLYVIGSEVVAERVFVDKNRGKIIGGKIETLHSIECAIAGNQHERSTVLCAKGTDTESLYKEIQQKAKELKDRHNVVEQLKNHAVQFEKIAVLPAPQQQAYDKILETMKSNEDIIIQTDHEIQKMMRKIKQAVIPQIEVAVEAHPGVVIQIGNKSSNVHTISKGTFTITDGVLNV